MTKLTMIAGVVLGLGLAAGAMAQAPAPNTEMATRIAEARRANAALMRQYSWTSRTEIVDKGQVKDIRIDAVTYGPGGGLERNLLNDQSAPLPFGFIRRKIAEDERKKIEEYLTGLRGLLEQYTLPTVQKVQEFMDRAKATGPDASGLFEVSGNSVVVPGDTFSIWVDPRTRHTRRLTVLTTFQGDQVTVTATFKTLASGLNHVAFAEAIVPAKQISVQVQNFDYNRNN